MPVRIRLLKKPQDVAKEINRLKGALASQLDVREQRLAQHGERTNELFASLKGLYTDIVTHFEKKAANRAIALTKRIQEVKDAQKACK